MNHSVKALVLVVLLEDAPPEMDAGTLQPQVEKARI